MKKIPTLFRRNPERMSSILPEVTPGCEWVIEGEGQATQKLDGSACMIDQQGRFFKRRTMKRGRMPPREFVHCETDPNTGKSFGWVPVEESDRYHAEAFKALEDKGAGSYELLGPKIQGNPERRVSHVLVPHSVLQLLITNVPRSFEGLRGWLAGQDIEGVVFHHADGRRAKIKLRDFELARP